MLHSSQDTAEILRDGVDCLRRAIEIMDEAAKFAGLTLVDDEGNVIKEMNFRRDTSALKARLVKDEARLAEHDKFIEDLIAENENEPVVD